MKYLLASFWYHDVFIIVYLSDLYDNCPFDQHDENTYRQYTNNLIELIY